MKKIILVEKLLKEDDAVFNFEEEAEFFPTLISLKPASKILDREINDGDITDKTDAFKLGLKKVEAEILDYNYEVRGMDISEFVNDFISDVLGINLYGPEMHHNLADHGIELEIKNPIDNTSDIIPPIKDSATIAKLTNGIQKRDKKHIVHKTVKPTILIGGGKQYIRQVPETIIEQLLLDGVPADTIIAAISHLWVFEHLSAIDDLSKELRKAYFNIKYAIGHKDMPTVRQIQDYLKDLLEDVDWELVGKHDGASQKLIARGRGLNQSLIDILTENDVIISSFKVVGGDF